MIGLVISCHRLNTSLHNQSAQSASAPCSNTPKNNLTILRTQFFETRHACYFMKQAKHVSTSSS